MIHATITIIKHTTNINAIAIFVNAHIIVGNAFVASVSHVVIQFHTIGKFVFSFIHLHFFSGVTTTPSHHMSADTEYHPSQQIYHLGNSQHESLTA